MSNATPRPWRIKDEGDGIPLLVDANGKEIGDVFDIENALPILAAVNAWDNVEALKARVAELEKEGKDA